jgi:Zn-dependent protease
MLIIFSTAYFLAWLIVFIFGTGLQRYCQAFVAERLGDSSPRNKGRLTLNPMAHHDPLGLFFAFILSLETPVVVGGSSVPGSGPTVIAWGKPLELNTFRLRGGRLARSLVALVGPLVFLLLAFLIWLATQNYIKGSNGSDFLAQFFTSLIFVSLTLCAFNLIPIPPMDGYEVLKGFLPAQWEPRLLWLEKYGMLIIIVLTLVVPWILRINILMDFYVRPLTSALGSLLGIGLNF